MAYRNAGHVLAVHGGFKWIYIGVPGETLPTGIKSGDLFTLRFKMLATMNVPLGNQTWQLKMPHS